MGQAISRDENGTPSLVLWFRSFLRLLARQRAALPPSDCEMSSDNNNAAKGLTLQRLNSIERKYPTTRESETPVEKMSDFKTTCNLVQKFLLNDYQLCGVRDALDREMKKGLGDGTSKTARGNYHFPLDLL